MLRQVRWSRVGTSGEGCVCRPDNVQLWNKIEIFQSYTVNQINRSIKILRNNKTQYKDDLDIKNPIRLKETIFFYIFVGYIESCNFFERSSHLFDVLLHFYYQVLSIFWRECPLSSPNHPSLCVEGLGIGKNQ